MTPEISEFSYGFALTNELVGWVPLSAAPIFPSLIEEGREGGGYDVHLDMPGIPLYLQFKRADCMKRSNVKEIRDYNAGLSLPFYRFKIMETGKSNQHRLLLELDNNENAVFYAAPRFHKFSEINRAWNTNTVASQSIFVSPKQIGPLDANSHHVSYDDRSAFICSKPRSIEFLSSQDLVNTLTSKLEAENQPLVDAIPIFLNSARKAIEQAENISRREETEREKLNLRLSPKIEESAVSISEALYPILPLQISRDSFGGGRREIIRTPSRPPRPLSGSKETLRELSDIASKIFDAQLVIVQKPK